MNHKYLYSCTALIALLLLGGCAAADAGSSSEVSSIISGSTAEPESTAAPELTTEPKAVSSESTKAGSTVGTTASGETTIDLSAGAAAITQSGVYRITGTLSEGSLVINVDKTTDTDLVDLIFDGVSIHSTDGTPVHIIEAEDVRITLEDGTVNTITQGAVNTADTEFPSAALYSKCDLVIEGTGTLNVTTEYNDGISSRDDLTINSGSLNIDAAGDGIVGKDSLTVAGGTYQIAAGKDGLRSTNETDSGKGVLTVSDGSLVIEAGNEGLEGIDVTVSGGTLDITSGDDGINVKLSSGTLTVSGGEIAIKSGGDGLDSNGDINQTGGGIVIDTSLVGQIDTPVDYDGTFTKTGGTLVDQSGNEINYTQMGMGGRDGPGMDFQPNGRML